MKTARWFLHICLLGVSTVCLAENPTGLGKSFDSAVKGARTLAERQKLTQVLVLVSAHPQSVPNPQQVNDLKQLEKLLLARLEAPELRVKAVAATEPPREAGQATQLLVQQQGQLLLTAELLQQERKTRVELALYTLDKQIWEKQVTIQGPPPQVSQTLAQAGSTQLLAQNAPPAPTTPVLKGGNQNLAAGTGALNTLNNLNTNTNNLGGTPTAGTTTQSAGMSEQQQSLNEKVLQFALDNLGKQVGNGECWTLASEALNAAGAEPAVGYSFGKEVALASLQPGDILQFTSAEFQDGNTYTMLGSPNHTAIVKSVSGTRVSILHQNFNGDKTVSELNIDLDTMTDGQIQAYRPQARGGAGNGPTGDGRPGEEETNDAGEGRRRCLTEGDSGPAGNVIININVNTNINIVNSGNTTTTTAPTTPPEPTAAP